MEALTTYRLRWTEQGRKHSRGYEREHFAVKALDRLRGRGISAELVSRPIVVLDDWTPYEKVQKLTLCAGCGRPVTLDGDRWVDAEGFNYCTEDDSSPRHIATLQQS